MKKQNKNRKIDKLYNYILLYFNIIKLLINYHNKI